MPPKEYPGTNPDCSLNPNGIELPVRPGPERRTSEAVENCQSNASATPTPDLAVAGDFGQAHIRGGGRRAERYAPKTAPPSPIALQRVA